MDPRTAVIAIPCLLRGGTEIQTLQLVKVLIDCWECDLTVICYFEADEEVVDDFQATGANVRLLNLNRSLGPANLVRRLRAEFGSLKPNVIHVQYMAPGLLPIVAARLAGCPKVLATVHQPWTAAFHGRKARWLLRFGARLCNRFICVSETAERSWFGAPRVYVPPSVGPSQREKAKHCTIHNSVDLERIDYILANVDPYHLRVTLGWRDHFVVGAVSRLRHEKGIDNLLKAFCKVATQIPSARLLVVGDGPDREKLSSQSKDLGIDGAVRWVGKQPWEKAIQLMSIMDIVAVPSRFEGFGLTAAEAMACRKPLVASDIGGLPEVVGSPGNGVLVPVGNPEALTNAILDLYHSPEKRAAMGLAGRVRVEKAFSFTRYRYQIRELYQNLAN